MAIWRALSVFLPTSPLPSTPGPAWNVWPLSWSRGQNSRRCWRYNNPDHSVIAAPGEHIAFEPNFRVRIFYHYHSVNIDRRADGVLLYTTITSSLYKANARDWRPCRSIWGCMVPWMP
jgi:hypothetical protein